MCIRKLQIKSTIKVKKEDLCLLVISDSRTVVEEGAFEISLRKSDDFASCIWMQWK